MNSRKINEVDFRWFSICHLKAALPPKTVITNETSFRHPAVSSCDLFNCSTSIWRRVWANIFSSHNHVALVYRLFVRKAVTSRRIGRDRSGVKYSTNARLTPTSHCTVIDMFPKSSSDYRSQLLIYSVDMENYLFTIRHSVGSMPEEVSPEKARASQTSEIIFTILISIRK